MKILVTGASGFIGSFVVEEGLKRGHKMWAGVRPTSSRQYLQDKAILTVDLDLAHPDVLRKQLEKCKTEFGGWDIIVHAAGATKCVHRDGFFHTNTDGTRHLAETLCQLDMVPQRFIFISSLSVYGAIREQAIRTATPDNPWVYAPIQEDDEPHPNTAYGESKLAAEQVLKEMKDFPYVILRPTGVYGPKEKDYFMMAESIKRHVDFAAGLKPQDLTFIYVKDLVEAVFLALERGRDGARYFLSDGCVYPSRAFSDLIRRELGNPWLLRLKAPLWLLRLITACGECVGRLTGRMTALNNDKYKIMRQRNWRCDIGPATAELGFKPRYTLARGVAEAVRWYKDNKWL